MHLTIAYVTSRYEPRYDWFFSSLGSQVKSDDSIQIVVVDYFSQAVDNWCRDNADKRMFDCREWALTHGFTNLDIFPPKPNVWQGPHRLTKDNWWAKSNALNTALCLTKGEYLVCTDDRGVLMPGWMDSVREAMAAQYILAGSYKKVADLEVEHGLVKSHGDVLGVDPRNQGQGLTGCGGEWCFGCSFGLPVEWALTTNGWDEDCNGLSFEDVIMGHMLAKNGFPIRYDPRMVLMEDRKSKDGIGPDWKRSDYGISPYDKSHAILNMVLGGARVRAPNYFGMEGIRPLRQKILAGEPFPMCQIPEHEWFTGVSLKYIHELKR